MKIPAVVCFVVMRIFTLTFLLFCVASITTIGLCQKIEFDEPFDIRERLDIPEDVAFQVASSGQNVYVLWIFLDRDVPIYSLNLAFSNDGGNNFDVRVLYSSRSDTPPVSQPQMAASDDTVHVAFFLGSSHSQIHYCHIPSDEDLPCQYVRIAPGLNQPYNLRLAVSGDNIYIAWSKLAEGNVYLVFSTDSGETFSLPINLSNDEDTRNRRELTDLVATDNDVYVQWILSVGFQCPECPPFLLHGTIVK